MSRLRSHPFALASDLSPSREDTALVQLTDRRRRPRREDRDADEPEPSIRTPRD